MSFLVFADIFKNENLERLNSGTCMLIVNSSFLIKKNPPQRYTFIIYPSNIPKQKGIFCHNSYLLSSRFFIVSVFARDTGISLSMPNTFNWHPVLRLERLTTKFMLTRNAL